MCTHDMFSSIAIPCTYEKKNTISCTSLGTLKQCTVQTLLLPVLYMLMHFLPHLLFDPCDSSHSTVHHGRVHLADAGTRIEDLETLLAVGNTAGGEYYLRL